MSAFLLIVLLIADAMFVFWPAAWLPKAAGDKLITARKWLVAHWANP